MDDFEYSVQMSEQDWNSFFQECEECDMLPPELAGLDDSGMSDFDEFGCTVPHRRSRQGKEMAQPDMDLNDAPLHDGPPVDMYLDRYGLRSPDYVLSGSEDDMHLESVNRFFEHLRCMTNTAEQSLKHHPTATGSVKRAQENRTDFNDEYPPINHLPKPPVAVKKNQDALSSGDVKPKSKTECRLLAKHTGIPSKATTDWYTRSTELPIMEEEQPVNPKKSHAVKENGRRDAAHNNLAKDTQLVQLRSSDTDAVLSSDLAACRNGTEVMRGDGQAMLRKNSELPQGQSPCTTPRRKKKRRKRMSMEPVEAGHSCEGQFLGNLSDSDEEKRSHRIEMEKQVCLPGEFGTVKMADKGNEPKRLSLQHPLIDSFSDQLPVQANSRTWTDSVTGPRELSTAGNQDDGIDLPRAPPGAYHSQTLKKTELRHRSTDMANERCLEEPLSPVQLVVKNSCKPDETPVSANVKEQTETPTYIFNNSVSTQGEGDKVCSNSKRTASQLLEAQKSDQVPVCHPPIANRTNITPSPIDAQIKTGLPLSQNGVREGEEGHSHSSAPLPQISNSSPLDPGKNFPQGDSSVRVKTQNGIRPKLANETNKLKNLQDLCLGFDLKRNDHFNQMAPTFHTQNSFDVPKVSTESTGANIGHSSAAVDTLKCLQFVKIPHDPTNKDSPAFSDNVSQTASDVLGAKLQTSLLDNNNKPSALPAHLHGPAATAECPPALGNTTSDKQMQIREESAEQADRSPDNTWSKQIITYPAETDPKGSAPCCVSPSTETGTKKHGMPQMTSDKQSRQADQPSPKTDSDVRSESKTLCNLSKAGETDEKVALYCSTNASSNTGRDEHNEMNICNDLGNSQIQMSSATSNAVIKESCKAVVAQSSPNKEAAKPDTDANTNTCPQLSPEEDSEDTIHEKRDIDAVASDPPPVYALSSFWSEMEKLTINDILCLRMVSHAQHPSILTPLDEENLTEGSHARDSGYFTHVDDSRPDRSSGDMSTMSDFDEEPLQDQEVPKQEEVEESSANCANVLWVSDPDSPTADCEAEDVVMLSTDMGIPQSRFAEQQYFRKMCKNISMQNLRVLENQPLRQILRNASVQSLRSLDDDNSADPFYHIDPSAQFSDDESVDGHGFSLSEMIEYLFCDDDAKSTVSETENLISSHIIGTSVPETYDDFFTEFETASLFFPEGSTRPDSSRMLPIFSCSRSANRNLQFPEVYDHFFPDSPSHSDEEEDREHSPPIRVVSRYDNKASTLVSTTETTSGSKTSTFWTSPLSLRRVRRTGITIPPSQTNSLSLVPANSTKKTGRRPIQPFSVMGYDDQACFPDPLLCDLESRIFRKLAEQQMRCPETAVVDPRIDAPLVPLKQSDMCLVCIAFASWVMKSVSPQGADTWKAVLLANISALSAIRYLRRYVRDEATGAKPLHQIQS